MCENPNPQELQEIELTLCQEKLGTEQLTLTSQVVDSEMLDAYNKAKKEKYHKYYLNKKQKKLEKEQGIEPKPKPQKVKKSNFTEQEELLLQEIVTSQESQSLAKTTKQSHMIGYKMLIKCLSSNRDALIHMLLNEQELVIQMVDDAKQLNGEPYSNQSRNKMLQTIRPLLDLFKVSYSENILQAYRNKMEEYNFNYLTKSIQKEVLPTYQEYLTKLVEHYSDRSMEYLLINMYLEVPVRDDLQLKIVSTKSQTKSTEHNYLLLNKKSCVVILNNYKTAKHYGQKTYELSKILREMVVAYISTIETGPEHLFGPEYLFGNVQLSPVVSAINKQLGYSGGINLLRKMIVTDLYRDENSTHEQKIQLADKMCHSVSEALLVYSGKLNDADTD